MRRQVKGNVSWVWNFHVVKTGDSFDIEMESSLYL